MPVQPGAQLGPYEIKERLGAGGMGEVYRAHDDNLRRDVALKLLPEELAADPQRLARLKREARSLAALNHPHIAGVYGFEQHDGTSFIVMELVEGETLADRLASGPLRVEEALGLAVQIARALEAAHEREIVHRDLKPSNVKITPADEVKLLDFGLAKPLPAEQEGSELPTATVEATRAGTILGTAPYMSPEQVRGQEVDERTDIWALGCVLYEMLTGRKAFAGETRSDTLAAVLGEQPDWDALPARIPARVRLLLRRCLEKDPAYRLHHVADARIELADPSGDGHADVPRGSLVQALRRQPALSGLILALVAILALAAGYALRGRGSRDLRQLSGSIAPQRLEITLPAGTGIRGGFPPSQLAVSPDGSRIAFSAGVDGLFVRRLDALDAERVPGVREGWNPFFSPDSKWLGFGEDGKLKVVPVDGGAVRTLCDAPQLRGASWGDDDTILFAFGEGHLARVPARGGEPEVVASPDPDDDVGVFPRWPQLLPGGRHALFTTLGSGIWGDKRSWQVALLALESGETRVLLESAAAAQYLPSGHLLYLQVPTENPVAAILMVAPYDPDTGRATGPGVPAIEGVHVGSWSATPFYAVSRQGLLAYVPTDPSPPQHELVWVDRSGDVAPASSITGPYSWVRLDPDGRRVAVGRGGDVWIIDLARDTGTRLTTDGPDAWPVWSPDGREVLFIERRSGDLYRVEADGSGLPRRIREGIPSFPLMESVSPDGRYLFFLVQPQPSQFDLHVLELEGEAEPQPWLATSAAERAAAPSPDGHWVAYSSDKTGRSEVYVRPFVGPGPEMKVSTHGGSSPVWSRDGDALYYEWEEMLWVASVRPGGSFAVDLPRSLLALPDGIRTAGTPIPYDLAPDGERFLMVRQDPRATAGLRLVVVSNWLEELERLVPTGR